MSQILLRNINKFVEKLKKNSLFNYSRQHLTKFNCSGNECNTIIASESLFIFIFSCVIMLLVGHFPGINNGFSTTHKTRYTLFT